MDDGDILSKDDIIEKLSEARNVITEKQNSLSETLFPFMDTISRIALAYKDLSGADGWASSVKDASGNTLFSSQQAEELEGSLEPQIVGGALSALDIRPSTDSKLVKLPFDTSQLSIDDTYYKVRDYIHSFDTGFKEMVKILGPIATLNQRPDIQTPPIPPFFPEGVKIPNRMVLTLIYSLLETIRLVATYGPIDLPFLRKLNSLALAILDIFKGDWKNAILSFAGVFKRDWVLAGLIGKLFRLVYSFIGQDLQNKLEDTLFQSTKSAFVGFWFYMVSLLAPEALRMEINRLAEQVKALGQPINEQIQEVEALAQKQVSALGLQVTFPRVPLDVIPSIDDLQNIQTILRNPDIMCLPPIKAHIQTLSAFPSMRLIFELMNIPTNPVRLAQTCEGQPQTVEEAITKAVQPTVTKIVGGSSKSKTRRRKAKKSTVTRRKCSSLF